jgi:hypothetical protein
LFIDVHDYEKLDLDQIEKLFGEKKVDTSSLSPCPDDIRAGFKQLTSLLSNGLNGTIQPGLHVLSADCGSGKSRQVQGCLKEWKDAGFPGSESLLICLATLDEIDSYITGSGLQKPDYAVVSSDPKYNGYGVGSGSAGLARVVFTTHEQFNRRVRERRSFVETDRFQYLGQARSFIIWDEAFHSVQSVSFSVDALRALPDALIGCAPSVVDAFRPIIPDSAILIPGGSMVIPADIGPFADQAMRACMGLADRHRAVLEGLRKLSGCRAYFKLYGARWSIVGVGSPLPDDLPPMIVLDASARLTDRYARMEGGALPVHMLHPVVVDYSNLTIRWIDRASGKEAFKEDDTRHANWSIVADLANGSFQDDWLLGCAKRLHAGTERDGSPPADLASMLGEPYRCSVVTWGKHHGSNAYRNIRNVIVVGAWDYPGAAYDAIHMAKGKALDSTGPGNTDARDMEYMSNVFQMVCRSNVRNHVDGVCGEATVYLMMPTKGGRRALLEKAFPGCRVETFLPPSVPPRTRAEKVIAAFDRVFQSTTQISYRELRQEAGGGDSRDYLTKPLATKAVRQYMKAKSIRRRGNDFMKTNIEKHAR